MIAEIRPISARNLLILQMCYRMFENGPQRTGSLFSFLTALIEAAGAGGGGPAPSPQGAGALFGFDELFSAFYIVGTVIGAGTAVRIHKITSISF